jgi:putative ABC transport system permease protein
MTLSRLLRISHQRVRSVLRQDAIDGEVSRELAFHFDSLVEENISNGMAPDQARRAARAALGNPAVLEEACRDHRRVSWIHDLPQDITYALRILRRNPGFTIVASLSLALGIGVNAATIGAIDAVLVRMPRFNQAERLVIVRTARDTNPSQKSNASVADLVAWQERSSAFEAIAASLPAQADLAADAPDTYAERLQGYVCTANLFPLLGVQPALGRVFTDADSPFGTPGSAIVVSHGFWQRRFGGDAGILGRRVRLNGTDAAIVGVMPESFAYPDHRPDFWAVFRTNRPPQTFQRFYLTIARLKPGVAIVHAQADLTAINRQLIAENPARHRGHGVYVEDLRDVLFGWTRRPLLTLQAAALLVLLLACVNVASLTLARGTTRAPELGLRMALGARRGRVVRQLLTESVLLSLVAGGGGLVVTALSLSGVMWLKAIPGLPDLPPLSIDSRTVLVTLVLSIAAGLLCGLGPALAGSKRLLAGAVRESERAIGPPPRLQRLRGALVAAQLALALILLAGAGLLLNSFVRLATRDLNFDARGLLSFEFQIPIREYLRPIAQNDGPPYFDVTSPPSQRIARVLERLRAVPGVVAVGGVSHQMVNRLIVPRVDVVLEDRRDGRQLDGSPLRAAYFMATPNLFSTLRTPVVRGRAFEDRDTYSAPWVAVVNETMAREFWRGEDPIGKWLTLDIVPEEQPREVVGIVRDIPVRRAQAAEPVVYTSYVQQPLKYGGRFANMPGQMTFFVRGGDDPTRLVPAIRSAVASIEPELPIANVGREEREAYYLFATHSHVFLVGIFAALAMVLAAVGVYGVMSYAIAQRTREIGIRVALGAGASQIVSLVARHAIAVVSIGLVGGLAGALLLTRLIESQLWGVTPTDPPTFAAVSAMLVGAAALACLVPVRRALRVDPTIALKTE